MDLSTFSSKSTPWDIVMANDLPCPEDGSIFGCQEGVSDDYYVTDI